MKVFSRKRSFFMPFKPYKPTKADAARAVAAQLKAAGQPPLPQAVLAILEQRGIKMDPGHCSVITREFRKSLRRARKRQATKVSTSRPTPAPTITADARLLAAAQFAKSCGGFLQAKKTLAELTQILAPLVRP
jgi:hypothetical protein